MAYKPPRSLAESEELLRKHAAHERAKGDWAFLGNSAVFAVALVAIVGGILLMVGGWFR